MACLSYGIADWQNTMAYENKRQKRQLKILVKAIVNLSFGSAQDINKKLQSKCRTGRETPGMDERNEQKTSRANELQMPRNDLGKRLMNWTEVKKGKSLIGNSCLFFFQVIVIHVERNLPVGCHILNCQFYFQFLHFSHCRQQIKNNTSRFFSLPGEPCTGLTR